MLPLPRFYLRDKDNKPLAFGRAGLGSHQSLYLPESQTIVVVGFDEFDEHSETSGTGRPTFYHNQSK
jgi:hypothetical protein